MGSYFSDLWDDFWDYLEDFSKHLFRWRWKSHKKTKKALNKRHRPLYSLAVKVRGLIYFTVGLSIIYTAYVGAVSGMTGVKDIVTFLITTWAGRLMITVIGISYIIHGGWKFVMGAE